MSPISIFCIALVLFFYSFIFGMLMYKLWTNPKWFCDFLNNRLEDKDLFTRFIKFMMS